MAYMESTTISRKHTLQIDCTTLPLKLRLENLHEAIRHDFGLVGDEIQSIEPDHYYKRILVRVANLDSKTHIRKVARQISVCI